MVTEEVQGKVSLYMDNDSFVGLDATDTCSLVGYFVDRDLQLEGWTFRIPFSLLGGLIISLVLWWSNEAKYKNARIDARIKLNEK